MRFLHARDRLIEPEAQDRFGSLRREYDQYLVELRGLSAEEHGPTTPMLSQIFSCAVLASQHPKQLGTLQRIIGLPLKHGAQEAPIDYLERSEIEAVLNSIDRATQAGRRDYALFALMFNTGARV